jgi:hypothetical protein
MITGCVLYFEESRTCIRLIILGQLFWMPLILVFFKRVPSYESYMFMGVIMAIAVSVVIGNLILTLQRFGLKHIFYALPIAISVVYFFIGVFGDTFFAPYDREIDETYQALIMVDPSEYKHPAVTGMLQEYIMEFLYDVEASDRIEDADYLMIKKEMYEDEDFANKDYIKRMHRSYENGSYIILTN